jgi:hypothetical protein
MTRLSRLLVCAAAAVLMAAAPALAQAPKVAPAKSRKVVPVQTRQVIVGQPSGGMALGGPRVYRLGGSGVPALPGYYQLGVPNVQKELELVPEQIEKLKEIGKKYYEEARADRNVWKDWQKMTPEERKAKSAEIREKYKKRAEAVKAEVEKVLLPQQIDKLKEIDFRTRAPYALRSPWTLKQLGISDQQKEKLNQIREKTAQQYRELQKKALEDALNVLTAEQKDKLKKQLQTRRY